MWKNIFTEACILSLLIFGGFYINASIMKEEIFNSQELMEQRTRPGLNRTHFSGNLFNSDLAKQRGKHISGNAFGTGNRSSISGAQQPSDVPRKRPHISGNNA